MPVENCIEGSCVKNVAVHLASEERAENVGIQAIEMYFPRTYVAQDKLEEFSGVSKGKFTIGLGQDRLAFVSDREDVYSMSLTVVQNLMTKYGISYERIGRLEVATETIMDHSKSVKSTLMQLFEQSGNSDVEGIDSLHACYAGTNALFNSVSWMESNAWDGRLALIVVVDIAEYAQGAARPTGGAGAVALLIAPNAPIVLEPAMRSSHMAHAYDFYKPNLSSPYPIVDGHFSNICYLQSLDTCYRSFVRKFRIKTGTDFDLDSADFTVFHAPYNKLVQKSFARILYNDFLRFPSRDEFKSATHCASIGEQNSYDDRELSKTFASLSKSRYESKVLPSTLVPKRLGNMYTASLYAGLSSLLSNNTIKLAGKRILMFSYGSGLASSLFSLIVRSDTSSMDALANIRAVLNLNNRLDACVECSPQHFSEMMVWREKLHTVQDFKPKSPIDDVVDGAYYLTHKDNKCRRFYERRSAKGEYSTSL